MSDADRRLQNTDMIPAPMLWLSAISSFAGPGREQQEDLAHIRNAAGGDGAALAALYDRHARSVYSLALRVVTDEADAEEVVQEVFDQAWRQASRYDPGRGSVAAWLMTMARTRAIDRLRARQARPDRAGQEADDYWRVLPAAAVDPAATLDIERDVTRLRQALQRLPLIQRIAIELAYFEGLTQRQIAERLEEPLGTVKTRIRLALLKLRDALSMSSSGGAV
jgi:RNA polymerase sigma-70 factor (ECF subfamily)